jgi:predicted aldo/keto reductase-like oxidoreductase
MAMEYRKLGRTGIDVSVIGLGTEHLEQSRTTMEGVLHTAIDAGVNYVDVLYGDPEGAASFWDNFGPSLRPCRDKLVLAAHWERAYAENPDKCQHCLDAVLASVGNEYAEVAIIGVVDSEEDWDGWAQEALDRLLHYKEQGRIGHIGVSGHFASAVIKAVKSGGVDVAMFGINLIGHDSKDTRSLCQACVDQGVGLVAMKPYFGGTLLCIDGQPTSITPVQCLSYVLSQPVSTAIPGVRNVEELQAALHYLEATDEEKDYHSAIVNMHVDLAGHCVYCNHCLPCPQGINVGEVILLTDFAQGGVTDDLRDWYDSLEVKASECVECGECMERCPFGVDIIPKMLRAAELFESRAV